MPATNRSQTSTPAQSLLRKLVHEISHADDAFESRYTESGQGVMRIAILSGLLLIYLATYSSLLSDTGELNRVFVAAIFSALVLALFTFWHIRVYPEFAIRKVFTTAIDSGYIALGLFYSPESAGILLPIYLWLSIGNGFRYGVGHLVYTSVLNLLFFTAALLAMGDERFALIDGKYVIGIYVAMVITPAYTLVLFRRLSRSLKEERKVSKFKSRFLANMSHELRTPINAILNANLLLLNSRREREKKRYSNLINSSSRTLLDLIDQVLDLNKIEADSTVLKHEPVQLYELLIDIADSVRANTVSKGIRFKEAFSPDLPLVIQSDATRVKQILINLLNNATKFTNEGGIIFRACLRERDGEKMLHFSVEDTGPGVAKENEAHIFKPFFQEDSTFDSNLGGAGIGLSISQSFANLLGGHIGYLRRDGKTVFECWLPIHEGATGPAQRQGTPIRLGVMKLEDALLWTQLRAFAAAEPEVPVLIDFPSDNAGRQRAAEQADLFPLVSYEEYFGRRDELIAKYRPDLSQTAFVLAGGNANLDPLQPDDFLFDRTVLIRTATASQGFSLEGVIRAGSIAEMICERSGADQTFGVGGREPSFNGHVLVIDDNDINRTTISAVLRHHGLDASTAPDGGAALATLEQAHAASDGRGPVDLIICDLQMPGMSGHEFIVNYQERFAPNQQVPIFVLTADIRRETREALEQIGVRRFLTKPIDPRNLMREVGAVFSAQAAQAGPTGIEGGDASGIPYALIDDMAENGMAPEQVQELVVLLEQNAEQSFRDLYLAYEKGDRESVAFLLHRLTGSLSALGAVELANRCRSLLEIARSTGLERLSKDDFRGLQQEIDDFIAGSQARLSQCLAPA